MECIKCIASFEYKRETMKGHIIFSSFFESCYKKMLQQIKRMPICRLSKVITAPSETRLRLFSQNLASSKEAKNNSEHNKLPSEKSNIEKTQDTPSFLTQVYNLRNGIEALEKKIILPYFPKSSVQMTPYFLNEMVKPPKNYYWMFAVFLLISGGIVYLRYLYRYKQFGVGLFDVDKNQQENVIATLRNIQLASTNHASFSDLMKLNIDKIVDRLNCDELNIEIKKETLATIISLMKYEYFVKRFAWKRDFLSEIADCLTIEPVTDMAQQVFEIILSSPAGISILKQCPRNFLNATEKILIEQNNVETASKMLYSFYGGDKESIDSYIQHVSKKTDPTVLRREIEKLEQDKTPPNMLKLDQNRESNTLLNKMFVRAAVIPFEVGIVVAYCIESWKRRANSPLVSNLKAMLTNSNSNSILILENGPFLLD